MPVPKKVGRGLLVFTTVLRLATGVGPKWAKPGKSHDKASARSFTGAEAAEIAANHPIGYVQGQVLPLEYRRPRKLSLSWQLPASTAPPSLGQVEAGLKRKREGTIRYKEGREDGYTE